MDNPLVSIVVPSYNQGQFIAQTITSCLEQDYRPLEIIVMDGASTDNTVEVLKSFGDVPELSWISEPDSGVVDAVNKGLARAQGAICGIQSSDDCYTEGAISEAVDYFRAEPDLCLVYADTIKTDADGAELGRFETGPFSILNFLSKQTIVLQPAAFFSKSVFDEVGGWSPDFFNADTECWLRMIVRHPARKVNAFWGRRRMHDGQRDLQGDKIVESYTRMMLTHPDIQNGPSSWRRAARCGVIRHELRYARPDSIRTMRHRLWRAVLIWPGVLKDPHVAGLLIPFYYPLRRRLMQLQPGRKEKGSQ